MKLSFITNYYELRTKFSYTYILHNILTSYIKYEKLFSFCCCVYDKNGL